MQSVSAAIQLVSRPVAVIAREEGREGAVMKMFKRLTAAPRQTLTLEFVFLASPLLFWAAGCDRPNSNSRPPAAIVDLGPLAAR